MVFDGVHTELLVLWLAQFKRRPLKLEVPWVPKNVWMAAPDLAGYLPCPGTRRSVCYRLNGLLRKHGAQAAVRSFPIDRAARVSTRELRGQARGVLLQTEHEDSVAFALKRAKIIRSKVPTLHEAGREHRTFAKNFVHSTYEILSAWELAEPKQALASSLYR